MSSTVLRSERKQRKPRSKLDDFSSQEQAAIEAVRSWFPGDVAVFGSRARGNWAEDSDLDIGVHGYNYRHHKSVIAHLRGFLEVRIDLFKIEHALTHKSVVVL